LSNVTTLPLEDERLGPPDAGFLLDIYLQHQRDFRDAQRDVRLVASGLSNDNWYASSLGNCYRQQYLQRLGVPRKREIDEQARRTFAWGDHVEDFLRKMYQRCGLVKQAQIRLQHGSLVARGDLLLRYPPQSVEEIPNDIKGEWSPEWIAFLERLRAVIAESKFDGLVGDEIKSTHSRAMKFLFKEGKPRDNHSLQVGASMVLTDLMPDAPKPDWWQVEYMGKDAVGILRFRVREDAAEKALERWQKLDAIWDAQPDPLEVECECVKEKWRVTYCAYYDGASGTCCGNAGLTAKSQEDPF
jgi:hypothetical protein